MATATNSSSMATAFNNIPARSRMQREAQRDKELLEKDRLRQRREGFVRADPQPAGALLAYDTRAQGFLGDADRFHSDTAGEARALREERNARTKLQQARRRQEGTHRELARWEAMDAADAREEQRWQELRASGSKARRNLSGEPFNPVTLRYNDGRDGERLRAADERVKSRALLRAENLQRHNAREGVNPITGAPLRAIRAADLLPPPNGP